MSDGYWVAILRWILIGWIIILIIGIFFPIPFLFLPVIIPLIIGAVILWFLLGILAQTLGMFGTNLIGGISFLLVELGIGGFSVMGVLTGFLAIGGFIVGIILVGAIAICFVVGYAIGQHLRKKCRANPSMPICKLYQ